MISPEQKRRNLVLDIIYIVDEDIGKSHDPKLELEAGKKELEEDLDSIWNYYLEPLLISYGLLEMRYG